MKKKHKGVLIMILCTFFLTAAQLFQKLAGAKIALTLQGTLLNWPFFVGLAFAGMAAVLMTKAFKYGDLSSLFPIISLSFIWTALLAVLFFSEPLTLGTLIGIPIIVLGVSILGRSGAGA